MSQMELRVAGGAGERRLEQRGRAQHVALALEHLALDAQLVARGGDGRHHGLGGGRGRAVETEPDRESP